MYNRDILFRGKQVSNCDWIEGYVFPQCIDGGYAPLCITTEPICANDYSEILGNWAVVDSSTVGQYTGLTDKNGKKIFEGDIIQGIYNLTGELIIGYVEYYQQATRYSVHSNDNIVGLYQCRNIKVIGNIHDNPELLEECK